jgi:hypothetical protein
MALALVCMGGPVGAEPNAGLLVPDPALLQRAIEAAKAEGPLADPLERAVDVTIVLATPDVGEMPARVVAALPPSARAGRITAVASGARPLPDQSPPVTAELASEAKSAGLLEELAPCEPGPVASLALLRFRADPGSRAADIRRVRARSQRSGGGVVPTCIARAAVGQSTQPADQGSVR